MVYFAWCVVQFNFNLFWIQLEITRHFSSSMSCWGCYNSLYIRSFFNCWMRRTKCKQRFFIEHFTVKGESLHHGLKRCVNASKFSRSVAQNFYQTCWKNINWSCILPLKSYEIPGTPVGITGHRLTSPQNYINWVSRGSNYFKFARYLLLV